MKIPHPDGKSGGLVINLKIGDAIVLTLGDIQAEVCVVGFQGKTSVLIIRAAKDIKIDRKSWNKL